MGMILKRFKCALYVQILPRLETYYLDEWIEHHLAMGIDHIFIYDNGMVSRGPDQIDIDWVRPISKSEREQGLWSKKPNNDYFLDYDDDQIKLMLDETINKHPNVTLVPWVKGVDHDVIFPRSQTVGFKDAVDNNVDYDWWLHIDPDEYLRLDSKYNNDIHQLINDPIYDNVKCFYFHQRVFDIRQRDKKVREIVNWSYDANISKTLIERNIYRCGIHKSKHVSNKHKLLDRNTMMIHHYRGSPNLSGGAYHIKHNDSNFDKVDKHMLSFIDIK